MYVDKLDGNMTTAFYDEKASEWRAGQARLAVRINDLHNKNRQYDDAINAIETTRNLCRQFPTLSVAKTT